MKIVVAGSRKFSSKKKIYEIINSSGFDITEVVSGGSYGVDKIGELWALDHNISMKSFADQCKEYKNLQEAAFKRNELMADYADGLIAIWKNQSVGTGHMIKCMKKLKKPIFVIKVK
jgi:predicted Rossmann fold nucleotide-binding protein DprA/Smf involved in DNA uptake